MSVVIDLPAPIEARLEEEAQKAGVSPAQLAAQLVQRNLTEATLDTEEQKRRNAPSITLLESWMQRADTPATPEQIAEAEVDLTEFMRGMNAPRKESGERLHYPGVEESR